MIDASAKQGIDAEFNAIFKRGTKESSCQPKPDFSRDNKEEAVKLIAKALEILKDDDKNAG